MPQNIQLLNTFFFSNLNDNLAEQMDYKGTLGLNGREEKEMAGGEGENRIGIHLISIR